MTDNLSDFFMSAYENDSACVIIFDRELRLIWHNDKPAPFDINSSLKETLKLQTSPTPQSGDYSFICDGIIYDYHLTAAKEYYIISICTTPSAMRNLDKEPIRQQLENTISSARSNIMSIAASASELNDYFEEFGADENCMKLLNEQINMIMGNCARMLKKQLSLQELLKYYDPYETEPVCVDSSSIIENFTRCCQYVLGPRNQIQVVCETQDILPLAINPQRLEFLLMCVLLTLHDFGDQIHQIKLSAQRILDEININFTLIPTGDQDTSGRLLSKSVPLHKNAPQYELEKLIIKRCLEKYEGTMIESVQNGFRIISLRFPAADDDAPSSLKSDSRDLWSQLPVTPYHAMLSEISDFRYF